MNIRIHKLNSLAFLLMVLAVAAGRLASADEPLTAQGVGDVETPVFYRYDLGVIGTRLHEPSSDAAGNIWMTTTSDTTMYKYNVRANKLKAIDPQTLTGQNWDYQHLWALSHDREVYMCNPNSGKKLWIYNKDTKAATAYDLPRADLNIYGGHVSRGGRYAYLYDNDTGGVLKWDSRTKTGRFFPCPYSLGADLPYMYILDEDRNEYWGATWSLSAGNSNDVLKFDTQKEQWSGQYKYQGPLQNVSVSPADKIIGNTLYFSDKLKGRIIPFDVRTKKWGEAIPVPGFWDGRQGWFGYISGGNFWKGLLYMTHSTWTGGSGSIDGQQHHFIGSMTVFDPSTKKFSRLDVPTRPGESVDQFMADYILAVDGELAILAVNRQAPKNGIVLRTNAALP